MNNKRFSSHSYHLEFRGFIALFWEPETRTKYIFLTVWQVTSKVKPTYYISYFTFLKHEIKTVLKKRHQAQNGVICVPHQQTES